MVVITYNIKSFYLHNFYTFLLSCDLFARTTCKVFTHSAFKLSLAIAASSLGNCMFFVEQSDIVKFTSIIIMPFLGSKNSEGV